MSILHQSLVVDMPGIRDLGSQVEIIGIGGLSLNEPNESCEDEVGEMMS